MRYCLRATLHVSHYLGARHREAVLQRSTFLPSVRHDKLRFRMPSNWVRSVAPSAPLTTSFRSAVYILGQVLLANQYGLVDPSAGCSSGTTPAKRRSNSRTLYHPAAAAYTVRIPFPLPFRSSSLFLMRFHIPSSFFAYGGDV
jgi:hypothetical protein